jgi:ribosome-associated protein
VPTDDRLKVTSRIAIPLTEITLRSSRSSGPGGQHANKTESRIEATFDVDASETLSASQKRRVKERLGPVVGAVAQDARSQLRNRELALGRLSERLAQGLAPPPRPRRPTKPTGASVKRRLAAKNRQAQRKRERQTPQGDE